MKKSFKQVQKYLDDIPDINHGGCGIAALAMYYAAKREGKKVGIAYLYSRGYDDDCMEMNEKYKKGKSKKAGSCSHVVVRVGNRYYDSEGIVNLKKHSRSFIIDKSITKKHLKASINNVDDWNNDFNRKYVKRIEKFIGKKLKIAVK